MWNGLHHHDPQHIEVFTDNSNHVHRPFTQVVYISINKSKRGGQL